jgi:hypothetical protein
MNETSLSDHSLIDGILRAWFALTALAVAYVGYDQFKGRSEQRASSLAMTTMRWGWVLVTLYTGPFGFIVYWLLRRARAADGWAVPPFALGRIHRIHHSLRGW